MTQAYYKAKHIINVYVNTNKHDVRIVSGNGMTGAINKFLGILGFKVPENLRQYTVIPYELRPVVFISHMEHYGNSTSNWRLWQKLRLLLQEHMDNLDYEYSKCSNEFIHKTQAGKSFESVDL